MIYETELQLKFSFTKFNTLSWWHELKFLTIKMHDTFWKQVTPTETTSQKGVSAVTLPGWKRIVHFYSNNVTLFGTRRGRTSTSTSMHEQSRADENMAQSQVYLKMGQISIVCHSISNQKKKKRKEKRRNKKEKRRNKNDHRPDVCIHRGTASTILN